MDLVGKRMRRLRSATVASAFCSLINYYTMRKIRANEKAGALKGMLKSATACNLKKLKKFHYKNQTTKVAALQKDPYSNWDLRFTKSLFVDFYYIKNKQPEFCTQLTLFKK